jgi:hypothetical protein
LKWNFEEFGRRKFNRMSNTCHEKQRYVEAWKNLNCLLLDICLLEQQMFYVEKIGKDVEIL